MSSDDEESWHNSDSGECDDEVLSSLSPSDPESDHEPPIEKQVVPPIEEQEDQPADPCRKKRRKRKDHGPTGRPRGPPKGYKFTERKRLAVQHIRESLDGLTPEQRKQQREEKLEQSRLRREQLREKRATREVEGLTSKERDCLDKTGELPGTREALVLPMLPEPIEPSNVERLNKHPPHRRRGPSRPAMLHLGVNPEKYNPLFR